MMKAVELFVARRYLTSKRKIRFINIIGYVSVAGITVGVAALLIALSVFNGFSGVVTAVLVGFDPHVRIETRGNLSDEDYAKIGKYLKNDPKIDAFSPFVSGKAMLSAGSFNKVVYVKGIDDKKISEVSGLEKSMILGSLTFRDSSDAPGIVIGLTLADRLAAPLGEPLLCYTPYGIQSALAGVGTPQSTRFRVTGIYESNNKDYDGSYAYVALPVAQEIFNLEGKYSGVEIRLSDFNDADEIKGGLMRQLPSGISVSTWYDLHKNLYSVMRIERWAAYVLLSLIIVVASFNMLGSLTMGVIEKQRDISVLKSMGMTSKNIIRLFMVEGLLIGFTGTVLGTLIGLGVLYLQVNFQIFPLDPTIYIIPAIPVEIRLTDFAAIAVASLSLSFLAAYYPARRAASTLPSDGLRWE